MKIANKISFIFIIFTICANFIIFSIVYFTVKQTLQNAIYEQLKTDLAANARHIETYLELLKISIVQLSRSVVLGDFLKIRKENPQASQAAFNAAMLRLSRTKAANPEIYEFLLLDASGRVVASSNKNSLGLDKSADAYFAGGQENIFVKDAYYSENIDKNLIAVSGPILDSSTNEFIGVLVARVRMNGLDKIVGESSSKSRTREIYIVNKYGYMITRSVFLSNTFLKQKVDTDNFRNCIACHNTSDGYLKIGHPVALLDYRGIKVLGAYAYLPEMQWCLLDEIDYREALAPLTKIKLIFIIILLLVPALVYLISCYFASIILGPVNKLSEGMEAVGRGDFEYKIKTEANDEISQLSRVFKSMAINLQKSTTSIENLKQEVALREKTEEVLHKSEEQYRLLFTESKDAMLVLSTDGGVVSANPAAIKLFSCRDVEEICWLRILDLSPECQPDGTKSSDLLSQMFMLAVAKGSTKFNWLHRRLNGEDFDAVVLLSKFEIGGKVLLQATIRDITEAKRAESILQKSQIWFSRALDSLDSAVITFNLDAEVESINAAAQKLTGWSESQVIGKSIDKVLIMGVEGSSEKFNQPVLNALGNGHAVGLVENTYLITREGKKRFIAGTAIPMRTRDSLEIIGVALVFHNIPSDSK